MLNVERTAWNLLVQGYNFNLGTDSFLVCWQALFEGDSGYNYNLETCVCFVAEGDRAGNYNLET